MNPNLFELRRALSEAAEDNELQPPHARVFAAWIQLRTFASAPSIEDVVKSSASALGASRHASHVAVLGYSLNSDSLAEAPFIDGVSWLKSRQYFRPGHPQNFEADGLSLLGVSVGLRGLSTEDRQSLDWLTSLLERSLGTGRPHDWNEALIQAALMIASPEHRLATTGQIAADLVIALSNKKLLPSTEATRANAWELISSLSGCGDGMTRAAAQLAALTTLLRDTSTIRFGEVTVDDVARLLSGVAQRSMRRWSWDDTARTKNSTPARWDIENEYHVQDMLWSILAPVFPDLDDEEWLKSLGPHHPRADLAIPSLRLIVEVKFLRSSRPSALSNIVQEVAADASTYLQIGSGYEHLVAFVWDDSASTEQHSELRQGLLKITGVRDAIILPRPQKMRRTPA